MTSYNNEGYQVDIKATNLHMSARPAVAIGVGKLVVPDGTNPAWVNIPSTTGATNVLGVAIESREASDVRPITYTVHGYVRLVAGGAISAGSFLQSHNTGGKVVALTLSAVGDDAKNIGRALTSATQDGDIIEAFIDCMK